LNTTAIIGIRTFRNTAKHGIYLKTRNKTMQNRSRPQQKIPPPMNRIRKTVAV
jgi:hypothetical protein